ncbi:hypothetical protein [Tropicimonas sp.]|uniref:hypothetical protein n=1 Tax=Tropicimonas sp. TaxID=2067044 RepID=UPI003A8934EA
MADQAAKTRLSRVAPADTPSVTMLGRTPLRIATPARLHRRHFLLLSSFLLFVLLPGILSFFYLYVVADDEYSSRVSFSIRSEEFKNPLDALGAFGEVSTGTSTDADILNEYLRSQKLLEDIRDDVNLEEIYSKPAFDPVFAFRKGQPIEELLKYWERMAYITYDSGSGLIDVEVFAFTPEDAHAIATAVMNASSELVDHLSKIARDDTTRYTAFELEQAGERLTEVREKMRALRDREQIIDPQADLESQMGVLTALQQQLAAALIERDLLTSTTRDDDPRLVAVDRKIEAIRTRIDQERDKLGQDANEGAGAFASVVGDFEGLLADRQFAEQAYMAAAAAYDTALAEARRKSRYLAAHVPPTLAESSQYPSRLLIGFGVLGFCFLFWMIALLTAYGMRDRR